MQTTVGQEGFDMDFAAFPYFEAIGSVAAVVTAVIAYKALRSWQSQERAKRQAQFLDQLLDATHAFVIEVNKPIGHLRGAKIGMASHVESWADGDDEEKKLKGAVAYIEKRGEAPSGRMRKALASLDRY